MSIELTEKQQKLLDRLKQELSPVTASDEDFKFRGILYGDFGCGKTDLGIKIANLLGKKILLVYSDSAWTTILKYPEISSKTDKVPFGGLSQIKALLDGRDAGIPPYCDYDVLMWDTVSTSTDNVLRNLVASKGNSDKVPLNMKGLEEYSHYRWLEVLYKELIPRLRNSDLHIIYTAHKRDPKEKDVEKGVVWVRPAFPEATFYVVGRESNMIGYMYKNDSGGQRYIQLSGTREVAAKCQVPGIDEKTYKVEEIVPLLEVWLKETNQ